MFSGYCNYVAVFSAKPEARAQLEGLKRDPAQRQLAHRVVEFLRLLRDDPGDDRVRRRRYQQDLWGIPVRGSGGDWLILWRGDVDAVEVIYIGPDLAA